MTPSMKYLFAVAVLVGGFEAVSAIWLNAPEVVGQLWAAVFAVVMLGCAWAMWARKSILAATAIGVLVLIDVGSLPFYERTSETDWLVQGAFGVVGVVGIAAWVNVWRSRRAPVDAARG